MTIKLLFLTFFCTFFRYGHISWSLGNRVFIGGGLLPSQSRSSSISCAGKNLTVEFPQALHSALIRNQTKVWKTKRGLLQGDKAWSRDPKSALFEILQNKEHFY